MLQKPEMKKKKKNQPMQRILPVPNATRLSDRTMSRACFFSGGTGILAGISILSIEPGRRGCTPTRLVAADTFIIVVKNPQREPEEKDEEQHSSPRCGGTPGHPRTSCTTCELISATRPPDTRRMEEGLCWSGQYVLATEL